MISHPKPRNKGAQMNKSIRVAILDDHPAIAEGYRSRLSQERDMEVTDVLLYGEDLLPALDQRPADVLLLDVQVKTGPGNPSSYNTLHLIPELGSRCPDLYILVLSMYDTPALIDAVISAGASGYVLKDDVEAYRGLPEVIRLVARGELYLSVQASARLAKRHSNRTDTALSDRELEALSLCANYPEERLPSIAERMHIAPSTVRAQMVGVYRKLQANNRETAVAKARQIGLLPPVSPEPAG
jgi:DNA-binding NarL/FixJ family response regulator